MCGGVCVSYAPSPAVLPPQLSPCPQAGGGAGPGAAHRRGGYAPGEERHAENRHASAGNDPPVMMILPGRTALEALLPPPQPAGRVRGAGGGGGAAAAGLAGPGWRVSPGGRRGCVWGGSPVRSRGSAAVPPSAACGAGGRAWLCWTPCCPTCSASCSAAGPGRPPRRTRDGETGPPRRSPTGDGDEATPGSRGL